MVKHAGSSMCVLKQADVAYGPPSPPPHPPASPMSCELDFSTLMQLAEAQCVGGGPATSHAALVQPAAGQARRAG